MLVGYGITALRGFYILCDFDTFAMRQCNQVMGDAAWHKRRT